MKQKQKILIIFPLLIVLCSFLFLSMLPFVRADSSSSYLIHYQNNLTPDYNEWLYQGYDAGQDWQTFLEGSNPNFTQIGGINTVSAFGVYSQYSDTIINRGWGNRTNSSYLLEGGRSYDKVLLLDSTSVGVTLARNDIDVSNQGQDFSFIAIEFIYLAIIEDTWSASSTNLGFGVEVNGSDVYLFNIIPNFFGGGGVMQGEMNYWDGGAWQLMYRQNYSRWDDGDEAYYYQVMHVSMRFTLNQRMTIVFSNITGTHLVEYQGNINPYQTVADDFMSDEVYLFFQQVSLDDQPLMVRCVDSSQLRTDYEPLLCRQRTWKTLQTYAINEIFTFSIPQATMYQENRLITNMTIYSALNYTVFKDFIVDITGNTEDILNITDLTNVPQQITSNIYYQNITVLQINTRYRSFDSQSFSNNITLNVTFSYTPLAPSFPILMLNSVLPIVILLIAPSAIAYTAFKKTGFLAMFFVMTLILTVTEYIPFVIGVLIMGVLITIFLKTMKSNDMDEG